MMEIEEMLERGAVEKDAEMQTIAHHIIQAEEAMNGEASQLEALNDDQSGEVHRLEEMIATKIEEMKQERKQTQLEIFDSIDQKCQPFADDIVAYRQQWQTQEEQYNAVIREEAENLASLVHSQRVHRDSVADGFVRRMNAEVAQIQEELAIEKKVREENENRLVKLLESICSRVHDEVQGERRSRQASEEKFMKVLEDTCNHLEAKSNTVLQQRLQSSAAGSNVLQQRRPSATGSMSVSYSGSLI
eukprot:TRINITY_DN38442_c0_g1_i1.p1 TRINITY_DN38442_c0_g1~~TRINITY_DN38442_c0_g1_i1.p1  ORF type:complete len:246 (+),score=71.61 TRINITY_DN38442_c0_g1_i1:97-834(+)